MAAASIVARSDGDTAGEGVSSATFDGDAVRSNRARRAPRRPVGQAEQLYLDVASSGHVPLQQDRGVAEESLRAGAGGVERGPQPQRSVATDMPMPPPPADALTMTGQPTSLAAASAASTSVSGLQVPGATGTPDPP